MLGAIGLLLASVHFALEWTHVRVIFFSGGSAAERPWVSPLVFTCLGLVLRRARAGARPPRPGRRGLTSDGARGSRPAWRAGRAVGLARHRPLSLRLRDPRVPRVAARPAAVGCAASGDREPHAALVRRRERAGRGGRAVPRLVARLEAGPGDGRERRPDRAVHRPRAAARIRRGRWRGGRCPRAQACSRPGSSSSESARRSTSARRSAPDRATR